MGHYLSDFQDDLSDCEFCGKQKVRSGLYNAICECDAWQLSHKTWGGIFKFRDLFTDQEHRELLDPSYRDEAQDIQDSAQTKIIKKLKSLGYPVNTLIRQQKEEIQSRKRNADRRVAQAQKDLETAKRYRDKVNGR